MSQQNIDFGTFPDDPSADAIRTAFNKVQNNFDQLFGANANTTVTSINRTPGAGITVNFPTGNVVVSANLACLQVSTSSLKMGRGGNTGSNALITQSSQTLVIDINPDHVYSNYFADVSNGLAIFNGNLSANSNYQPNLTSFGNLTSLNVAGRANFIGSNTYISSVSNLHIPGGGAGYTIVTDGAGNLSWSAVTTGNGTPGGNATEVQFQGSGGNLGKFSANLGFNFTTANGLLRTPLLTVAGNTISANFVGPLANGNSNISIAGNSNITFTSNSNSTMIISDTGANIIGTANISGNANVGNIGADQGIFITSANIPIIQNGNSNITIGANTTVSIFVAGDSNAAISATATGANILGIANISGNIATAGNISTTGSNGTIQANNFNITGAASGSANVSTVTGNLGIRALASTYTDNIAAPTSTVTTGAVHAIAQPTLIASNASVTFTNAATFYIANSPANAGSTTITNPYSLYIANGSTYFGGSNNYIAGNLTVAGTTTYYNVTSFAVQDPIISLGGGANGNALTNNDGKDRGTALQYYTSAPVTAFMGWDNSNSEFSFGSNVSIASEVVTYNSLGNARGLTWLGNVDGSYANLSGNLTSAQVLASANVTSPQFISNIATATGAPFSVQSTNRVANLNVAYANVSDFGVVTAQNTGTYYPVFVNANTTGNYAHASSTLISANLANGALIATTFIGNISGNFTSGTLANGSSNIAVASDGNITLTANAVSTMLITKTGANITGTANVSGNLSAGNVSATNLTGTLTTSAQPNITSVGTLLNTTLGSSNSLSGGNLISATYLTGTLTTVAQPNITSVGTLTSLGVSGTITAANITANTGVFTGNGNGLSSIVGANVTGQVGNALVAGTIYTNAQPNITSVGTLTSLGVSGTITAANITANTGVFTGNGNGLSSLVGANVTGTVGSATTAGTVTTATQPNITSVSTSFANLTFAANGNITMSGGSSQLSGANLLQANYVQATFNTASNGQPNVTSLGTLTGLNVNATVTATTFTSNVATSTAPFSVQSTTRVANLNVAYSNVSDFVAITAQTTGTYYPVVISGATSGNYAHTVGPTGISFNLATNTVSATSFSGNLTATGTVQAANITATAFITRAVTTGVSANGTTQTTATGLTTEINIVSAVSVNTGVRLPAAVAGTVVYITNNSANSLLVYPQTNGQINNLGANVAFTQGANATLQYMAPTTTQWYTIGATYA